MNNFNRVDGVSDTIVLGETKDDNSTIYIHMGMGDEKRSLALDLSDSQILLRQLVRTVNRIRKAKGFYTKYQLKQVPDL